mgnify:CR=1 FL=1
MAIQQHPDWYVDWLEEELVHLLLGHHWQAGEYEDSWAFHIAADLEARQYVSETHGSKEYQALLQRLHLPKPFTLAQAYQRIVNQHTASGNSQVLQGLEKSPASRRSHQLWESFSPELFGYWRQSLRNNLPQIKVLPGTRFGLLYNLVVQGNESTTIPWPVLLRRFALSGKRDQTQTSLRRPSKRYHTFPGNRRQRRAHLVVVLDTSGSISAGVRLRFFRELQQLVHLVHHLEIVEADNHVQRIYSFNGQIPEVSVGGGDTAFDPALSWANEQPHLDGVIYLTDGEGPAPTVQCRFPIMWLVTGKDTKNPAPVKLPGLVVHM